MTHNTNNLGIKVAGIASLYLAIIVGGMWGIYQAWLVFNPDNPANSTTSAQLSTPNVFPINPALAATNNTSDKLPRVLGLLNFSARLVSKIGPTYFDQKIKTGNGGEKNNTPSDNPIQPHREDVLFSSLFALSGNTFRVNTKEFSNGTCGYCKKLNDVINAGGLNGNGTDEWIYLHTYEMTDEKIRIQGNN